MRHSVCPQACLCLFTLLASCASTHAQVERTANFTTLPEIVRPDASGKYPTTHFVLIKNDCGEGPKQLTEAASYVVELAGDTNQPKPESYGHDACSIWFNLVPPDVLPGTIVAKIQEASDDSKKTSIGTAFLSFGAAIQKPQPIPTTPKVDVMWAPIGHPVCRSVFGRAVANNFWCIGLTIGNNSGYQLQVAGVGFKARDTISNGYIITPNSSYAVTRAVAQGPDSLRFRGYVVNGVAATGLLMAGFSPYFTNEGSAKRFNTGTSIVSGPLQAALNLIWPDYAQKQMNSLDDQSLRDGKLIPNNTQVRTVVFLDKGSHQLDYASTCKGIYGASFANSIYRKDHNNNDASSDDALKYYNGLLAQEIETKIRAIDPNEASSFDSCLRGRTSLGLKEALGDLVLIGDTIEFKERIVVDPTVQSQEAAIGSLPTDAKLDYSTLTITAKYPEKLPDSVIVKPHAESRTLTATKTGTLATGATYKLQDSEGNDVALPNGTDFDVSDSSGGLNIARLPGNTTSPALAELTARINSSGLLTLTGKYLLQLPDTITGKVNGQVATFAIKSRSDETAEYQLQSVQTFSSTGISTTSVTIFDKHVDVEVFN